MGLSSTAVITRLAAERLDRLERQPRPTLMAQGHEDVRVGCVAENDLERLRSGPQASAAWNDVPHPVKRTRLPSGSRRSPTRSGTWRSHSGWSAIDFLVKSPGTRPVYTIVRMSVFEKTTLGNGIR